MTTPRAEPPQAELPQASAPTAARTRVRRNALNFDAVELVKKQVDEMLLGNHQPSHRLLLAATVRLQEQRIQAELTRRRALNRWSLALLLLGNPSLIKLRRRRGRDAQLEDEAEGEALLAADRRIARMRSSVQGSEDEVVRGQASDAELASALWI